MESLKERGVSPDSPPFKVVLFNSFQVLKGMVILETVHQFEISFFPAEVKHSMSLGCQAGQPRRAPSELRSG